MHAISFEKLFTLAGPMPVFDPKLDQLIQIEEWKAWSARATMVKKAHEEAKIEATATK